MNSENFNMLCEKIEKTSGFRVYGLYEDNLKNIVSNYAKQMMLNPEEIIDLAISDSKILDKIIEALLINETYFFRHEFQFDMIRKHILPDIKKSKEAIRIWSAGCSNGCEPYSVAILIDKYFSELRDNVSIIGTDLSSHAIEIARRGIYSKWHVRNLDKSYLSKYFILDDNKFILKEDIRDLVRFKKHNLLKDDYFLNCDIVFCRNVLIYFNEQNIKYVVERFIDESLSENGYLFLAPGEFHFLNQLGYKTIFIENNIVFKKGNYQDTQYSIKRDRTKLPITDKKERYLREIKSLELLNNKEEAINLIENVQAKNEEFDKELLIEEIILYLNNDDLFIIEKKLREYRDYLSDDEFYFIKGLVCYKEKNYDKAVDYLRKAALLNDNFVYNLFLAFALVSKNDLKNAKYFFNMALTLVEKESSFESLVDREVAKKIIVKYLNIL
ncbi:hypothetical protein DEFDS_0702 [Deferribacter desulfuricans SSM1]|uniref:CheR-type methyltransferase domain-containing protein n=1 Tax=Deferribacter desulfuricans (strain DSM 14783 / JCM 11476 / NBRC 101012 / SSM1) TaxID=639282 RepID=D3PC59_DEFDS|nr:protein-glutamate O-methyltransferase CheR [Deferribacter desulfuricans]BAI80182.1 hypothetical protein DEFDS_0702 [Deferribacter desulfuricans SSM1]